MWLHRTDIYIYQYRFIFYKQIMWHHTWGNCMTTLFGKSRVSCFVVLGVSLLLSWSLPILSCQEMPPREDILLLGVLNNQQKSSTSRNIYGQNIFRTNEKKLVLLVLDTVLMFGEACMSMIKKKRICRRHFVSHAKKKKTHAILISSNRICAICYPLLLLAAKKCC